jgi:hypothetical protein
MGRPALRIRYGLLGRKIFYIIRSSDGILRIKHSDGSIVSHAYGNPIENGDIIATRDGTTRGFEGYAQPAESVEISEEMCRGL